MWSLQQVLHTCIRFAKAFREPHPKKRNQVTIIVTMSVNPTLSSLIQDKSHSPAVHVTSLLLTHRAFLVTSSATQVSSHTSVPRVQNVFQLQLIFMSIHVSTQENGHFHAVFVSRHSHIHLHYQSMCAQFTLVVQDPTLVRCAEKASLLHLIWHHISKPTLVNDHMLALFAASVFPIHQLCHNTWGYIQVKSPFSAKSAPKPSHTHPHCGNTQGPTPVIALIHVITVRNVSQLLLISQLTWESTQVSDHSNVNFVKKLFLTLLLFGNMGGFTLEKSHLNVEYVLETLLYHLPWLVTSAHILERSLLCALCATNGLHRPQTYLYIYATIQVRNHSSAIYVSRVSLFHLTSTHT